jgi:hypothetical protein
VVTVPEAVSQDIRRYKNCDYPAAHDDQMQGSLEAVRHSLVGTER